jgi:hypothetical protein
MDPKKDVSTAILDVKKAPNKLIVSILLARLKRLLMMRTRPSNSVKPKCQNSRFSKEMQSLSKERSVNKLLWLH